jgi:hypothetical protein
MLKHNTQSLYINNPQRTNNFYKTDFNIQHQHAVFFFCGEGPRSRCYGRTAALRLIVQPCDEDEEKGDQIFFPSNGAPVE